MSAYLKQHRNPVNPWFNILMFAIMVFSLTSCDKDDASVQSLTSTGLQNGQTWNAETLMYSAPDCYDILKFTFSPSNAESSYDLAVVLRPISIGRHGLYFGPKFPALNRCQAGDSATAKSYVTIGGDQLAATFKILDQDDTQETNHYEITFIEKDGSYVEGVLNLDMYLDRGTYNFPGMEQLSDTLRYRNVMFRANLVAE